VVIIDGHNLLHAIRKIEEDLDTIGDLQLCWIIDRYFKLTHQTGEVVFDGIGRSDKSVFDNISNLEVFFAGQSSADALIEEKIQASTTPKRLTIVSSDRRIRKAAQLRKAIAMKSEVFWNDVQKQLRKKKTVKEPAEKRLGLTESETQKWLEIFGIKQ
jgi:predicted RNA-binding protein with PIN domain